VPSPESFGHRDGQFCLCRPSQADPGSRFLALSPTASHASDFGWESILDCVCHSNVTDVSREVLELLSLGRWPHASRTP